jgi:OOP family OmpA-OmpF porin
MTTVTIKSVYDTIVSFLNRNQKISVAFLWHTRTIETPDYNLTISKRMATGIVAELVRQGIDANRLSAIGLGESMPIITEEELDAIKDNEQRSRADRNNERVEIIILATHK